MWGVWRIIMCSSPSMNPMWSLLVVRLGLEWAVLNGDCVTYKLVQSTAHLLIALEFLHIEIEFAIHTSLIIKIQPTVQCCCQEPKLGLSSSHHYTYYAVCVLTHEEDKFHLYLHDPVIIKINVSSSLSLCSENVNFGSREIIPKDPWPQEYTTYTAPTSLIMIMFDPTHARNDQRNC